MHPSSVLPESLIASVEAHIGDLEGAPNRIESADGVGGGDIHRAHRLRLSGGGELFLKWNPDAPPRIFEREAAGLAALRAAGGSALRVPEVMGHGEAGSDTPGWLLMEHVSPGPVSDEYAEALGRGLAELHRTDPPALQGLRWGWHEDNWIGSLPQSNAPSPTWAEFWRDRRIEPQLRMARAGGWFTGRDGELMDALVDHIGAALADVETGGPSLLHGDLWGGNVMPDAHGAPVIIDPAVYRGHREVDLAMSELFGFPAGFLPAYREAWPVDRGYDAFRRDLYQLYYLLVHVNLFGGGYAAGCMRAARSVLSAL